MYLFLPNLCLRLSEVQPGESSSVKSRCRWIFQIITPHPLYSSDSVSWEMFQPDLFSFGKPFQDFESRGYVWQRACAWCHAMASVTWPGSGSISFTFLFCLTQLWESRYVHVHIFGCAGMWADDSSCSLWRQVWKIWKRLLLYKNSILISYKITKELINEEDHSMLPN